jgi:mRNA-degrading endonuclease toxin of MazEF toxin-antitoxin module
MSKTDTTMQDRVAAKQAPTTKTAPKTTKTAAPKMDAAAMIAEVEKVAKATRIKGLTVETRQAGKRPVIMLADDAGTRLIAYVSPVTRGPKAGGFNVEVADYGGYRRETVADVAAAAAMIKTSGRIKAKAPKVAPKADAKEAAPKATKAAAKKDTPTAPAEAPAADTPAAA